MDRGMGTGMSMVGIGSKEQNSRTGGQDSLHNGVGEEVGQMGGFRL